MSDFLSHPLVLLLATAAIGGVLVPLITRQWQLQQKAIEVKSELITDIIELTSDMFVASERPGMEMIHEELTRQRISLGELQEEWV